MPGPIVTYELRDDEEKSNPLVRRNFADLINFLTLRNNGATEWNNLFVGNELATTEIRINNSATDGDPILTFQLSGISKFTQGVDDGDSDVWKMGTTAIGTGTMMEFTSAGALTLNALSSAGFVKNTAGGVISGGNSVDISSDTNLVGGTGITLTDDTLSTTDSEIVHDNLSGFVANEHIDHSAVTLTAGEGLSGGGDITDNRTFDVDLSEFATDTSIASGDLIVFRDISPAANNIITFANFEATLNHDALADFVADEHIAHAGVTLTAQDGITGGGTIAASRTFGLGGTFTGAISIDTEGNKFTLTHDGTENNIFQIENSGTTGDAFVTFTAASTNFSFGLENGSNRVQFTATTDMDSATIFSAGTADVTFGSGVDVFTTAWTDYSATSTIVGWSSFTVKSIFYKRIGDLVFVSWDLDGTSNATTTTFTVPITSNADVELRLSTFARDNGTAATGGGLVQLPVSSTTFFLSSDMALAAWTASGTKTTKGQVFYQA